MTTMNWDDPLMGMLDETEAVFLDPQWDLMAPTPEAEIAQQVWEQYAPAEVAVMPDPAMHFRLLGAVLAAKIEALASSMRHDRCVAEKITDGNQREAVLNECRLRATDQVMAEHVYFLVPSSTD
jgi:hypothetical protein